MPDVKDKDENVLDLSDNPQFQQLASVVGTIGSTLKMIQSSQTTLTDAVTTLTEKGIPVQTPKAPVAVVDEETLNDMSQSELVTHMVSEMVKVVDKKVGVVNTNFEEVTSNLSNRMTKKDLSAFAKVNPEFLDISDQVKAELESNPSMNFEDAFTLAKAKLPEDRRIELEDKYKEPEGEEGVQSFGGMTPTSGFVPEKGDEKLTKEQASEKAWEQTIEEFPALAGSS